MNLYLLSQTENNGYDTYDSCVVAAPDEDTARKMHPDDGSVFNEPIPTSSMWGNGWGQNRDPVSGEITVNPTSNYSWALSPDAVTVKYLGEAAEGIKQGVICASFNAG